MTELAVHIDNEMGATISHPVYMDDNRLYSKSEQAFDSLTHTARIDKRLQKVIRSRQLWRNGASLIGRSSADIMYGRQSETWEQSERIVKTQIDAIR